MWKRIENLTRDQSEIIGGVKEVFRVGLEGDGNTTERGCGGSCTQETIIGDLTTVLGRSAEQLYLARYGNPVSGTVVTHVGTPVAWGPRINDAADTVVPLLQRPF
ncbi:hypothetical protein TNCV_103571 [Trichonephila clavipes]|nr:hypothetical protein TNCV_103571 [Trichonephila clavipes]